MDPTTDVLSCTDGRLADADHAAGVRLLADFECAVNSGPISEAGAVFDAAKDSPFTVRDSYLFMDASSLPSLFLFAVQCLLRHPNDHDSTHTDLLTKAVLLINAGHGSAWNRRKQMLAQCRRVAPPSLTLSCERAKGELEFLDVVIRKAPKVSEVWAHRRWVLKQCGMLGAQVADTTPWAESIRQGELAICSTASQRKRNNYMACTHLQLVIEHAPVAFARHCLAQWDTLWRRSVGDRP